MTTLTELRRDRDPEAEAGNLTDQSSDSDHKSGEAGNHDHADDEVANRALDRAGASKLWIRTVSGGEGIFLSTCEDTSSSRAARGGGETVVLGDHQSTRST